MKQKVIGGWGCNAENRSDRLMRRVVDGGLVRCRCEQWKEGTFGAGPDGVPEFV
jgi:hypothetical protein